MPQTEKSLADMAIEKTPWSRLQLLWCSNLHFDNSGQRSLGPREWWLSADILFSSQSAEVASSVVASSPPWIIAAPKTLEGWRYLLPDHCQYVSDVPTRR